MTSQAFWLELASIVVPSLVVMFVAWLSHKQITQASADSKDRDDGLGTKIDRVDKRIGELRTELGTVLTVGVYNAGYKHGSESSGRPQGETPRVVEQEH